MDNELTIEEAARRKGVASSQVVEAICKGVLPFRADMASEESVYRLRLADIDAWEPAAPAPEPKAGEPLNTPAALRASNRRASGRLSFRRAWDDTSG